MISRFDHLCSFGLSAAQVPARAAAEMVAHELQLASMDALMQDGDVIRLTLNEIREPDAGRLNYVDSVRNSVARKWQPLVDRPQQNLVPVRLLAELNNAFKSAEALTGGDVRQHVAALFCERAAHKAEAVAVEAERLSSAHGFRAVVRWLESLEGECDGARGPVARAHSQLGAKRRELLRSIETAKTQWAELLARDGSAVTTLLPRVLVLTATFLVVAYGLWVLSVPLNSMIGLGATVGLLAASVFSMLPLFRSLRLRRQTTLSASNLTGAYRAASLLGLDEMAKGQELDYATQLRNNLGRLKERFELRLSELAGVQLQLRERLAHLNTGLHAAPPTICMLLSEATLEEWRERAYALAPRHEWQRSMVSASIVDWSDVSRQAHAAAVEAQSGSVESEIRRLYPSVEARVGFFRGLREAAIGADAGQAFLSLNLAAAAQQPPQAFVIVELPSSESELAEEIRSACGGGVGLSFSPGDDCSTITFVGLVYGYRLEAIADWPEIEADFQRVHADEGKAIFPVLFGDLADPENPPVAQQQPESSGSGAPSTRPSRRQRMNGQHPEVTE